MTWNFLLLSGWFLFGVAMTLTLTEIGKYSIGRMRPHFLSVCKPDFTKLSCDPHLYVTEYECTGDAKHIKEARLVVHYVWDF